MAGGGDPSVLALLGAPERGRLCPPAMVPCPQLLCSQHCLLSLYLLRWRKDPDRNPGVQTPLPGYVWEGLTAYPRIQTNERQVSPVSTQHFALLSV